MADGMMTTNTGSRPSFDYDAYADGRAATIQSEIDQGRWRESFFFEPFTPKFVEHVARCSLYVDCGAEYGYYAYLAIKNMRQGRIVLFEPEPSRHACLSRHFGAVRGVEVQPVAVAASRGEATFYKPLPHASATMDSRLSQYAEPTVHDAFTCRTVDLDSFFGDESPDIVKMDIEGAEVFALEGMRRILARRKTRLFIEVHEPYIESIHPGGMNRLRELFGELEYAIYACRESVCEKSALRNGRLYIVPAEMEP